MKTKNVPISDPVFLQKDHGHSKGKNNLHEQIQLEVEDQQKATDVDFESGGENNE